MQCPKCNFENPERMKYCGKCGAELGKNCPRCQFPNPPEFQFCGECGYALSAPSQPGPKNVHDESLAKIQRYLPEGLTQKILAQKDRIEGERKQITVLFCDMEGFTPLSERLGHEDLFAFMDRIYEILIRKINEYGGTVNKLTGDGLMALFGAPIALENAPQAAIRSALAIHAEIGKLSRAQQERGAPPGSNAGWHAYGACGGGHGWQ